LAYGLVAQSFPDSIAACCLSWITAKTKGWGLETVYNDGDSLISNGFELLLPKLLPSCVHINAHQSEYYKL
jgi:hypothetical protein